jgi:hypothetical protein
MKIILPQTVAPATKTGKLSGAGVSFAKAIARMWMRGGLAPVKIALSISQPGGGSLPASVPGMTFRA